MLCLEGPCRGHQAVRALPSPPASFIIWLSCFTFLVLDSLSWEEGRLTWGSLQLSHGPYHPPVPGVEVLPGCSCAARGVCPAACIYRTRQSVHSTHGWTMGGTAIFLHMVVKRKKSVEVLPVPPLFLIVGIRELKFWDNHGH